MSPTDSLAPQSRIVARWGLVALSVALPFESIRPLAHLGPIQISSVEVFLYGALGAWAISLFAAALQGRSRYRWSRAHVAVAGWVVALAVSAALAPAGRAAAAKFFLRSLGGAVLFAAAADLLRDPATVRWTVKGLSVGAGVAALAAIAEVHVPGADVVLWPFHPQTFDVLGLARASGTLQFPNIASMYFEAVVPVVIVVGTQEPLDGVRHNLSVILALTLLYAIGLTGSRAGLATAAASLAALACFRRGHTALMKTALMLLAGLLCLVAVGQATGSSFGARLRFWQDDAWYRSTIRPASVEQTGDAPVPARIEAGAAMQLRFMVRNDGAVRWVAGGPRPVRLGCHWIDHRPGREVIFDSAPVPLPRDMAPGDEAAVTAMLRAPDEPGSYELRWDLAREGAFWFSERGDAGYRQSVVVVPKVGGDANNRGSELAYGAPKPMLSYLPLPSTVDTSRRVLWRAAVAAFREHPLTGLGPDNFRHAYGRFAGITDADDRFHANSLYFETLASGGLVGILALAALVLGLAIAARRAVVHGPAPMLGLGVAVAVAAYLLHGVVDYFFEFTPTYGLFWLLTGMLVALGERPSAPATVQVLTAAA